MTIIDDLLERGLLDKCSNEENVRKMLMTKQTIYCGFDPSARSLQLGNFVMITFLRRLQLAGHRIIALVGGGTGMIGDPSGKASERKFLDKQEVNENVICIQRQIAKYLDFSSDETGFSANNADIWSNISVIDYLRDYGKLFQINYMLDKDIVKSRLETGISYAEFSYMILQSGDFLNLYNKYGCSIQVGGGDQWGNLTSSLDFVRRSLGDKAQSEVFTLRLITDSQGRKFGKSESGALYLDPTMTSPYSIYQYFMNVDDQSVGKYLKIFDYRPMSSIALIIKEHEATLGSRFGQKELARVVVTNLHGSEKAAECEKMTSALFTGEYQDLPEEALEELSFSLPLTCTLQASSLIDGLINSKLASSKREAREFLAAGSVRVNSEIIKDPEYILSKENALKGKYFFIKRGKKNFASIKIE